MKIWSVVLTWVTVFSLHSAQIGGTPDTGDRGTAAPRHPVIDTANAIAKVYGKVSKAVKILCPATGPRLEIIWTKGGLNLIAPPYGRSNTRLVVTQGYHYLRMKFLSKNDDGVYTCKAVNGWGAASYNITLEVIDANGTLPASPRYPELAVIHRESAPQWGFGATPSLRDVTVSIGVGETLMLDCSATGRPRPSIVWYLNNMVFQDSTPNQIIAGHLLTHPMMKKEFEGTYKCVVSNSLGDIQKSWKVRVDEVAEATTRRTITVVGGDKSVEWLEAPSNVTVREGGKASLTCKVDSLQPPTITWLKEVHGPGQDIISLKGRLYNITETRHLLQPTSGLPASRRTLKVSGGGVTYTRHVYVDVYTIDVVRKEDAGRYACGAVLGAQPIGVVKEAFINVTPGKATATPVVVTMVDPDAAANMEESAFLGSNVTLIVILVSVLLAVSAGFGLVYFIRHSRERKRRRALQKRAVSANTGVFARYNNDLRPTSASSRYLRRGIASSDGTDPALTPLTSVTPAGSSGIDPGNGGPAVSLNFNNHHAGGRFSSLNSRDSSDSMGSGRKRETGSSGHGTAVNLTTFNSGVNPGLNSLASSSTSGNNNKAGNNTGSRQGSNANNEVAGQTQPLSDTTAAPTAAVFTADRSSSLQQRGVRPGVTVNNNHQKAASNGSTGGQRRHNSHHSHHHSQPRYSLSSSDRESSNGNPTYETIPAFQNGNATTVPNGYEPPVHHRRGPPRRKPQTSAAAVAAYYQDRMETDSHYSSISNSRFDQGTLMGGPRPQMPVIPPDSPYEDSCSSPTATSPPMSCVNPPSFSSPPPAPPGSRCGSGW